MKRWHWLAAVLALFIAFGAVWYRYGHQKIRLATDAEVRAVVPADLLPGPPDPAAIRRYDQLCALRSRIAHMDPGPSAIAKRAAIADAAVKIAGQGLAVPDSNQPLLGDNVRVLADALDLEAQRRGKAGDSRGCEMAIADALELARAIKQERAIPGYGQGSQFMRQAMITATSCILNGRLKPAELRSLIQDLPERGLEDPELMTQYRLELRYQLFEPHGLLKSTGRWAIGEPIDSGDAFANTGNLLVSVPRDPLLDGGNFDTLEAAKLLAALTREGIESAARPWSDQPYDVDKELSKQVSELPPFPVRPGGPSEAEELRFFMAMNAIPNSQFIRSFEGETPIRVGRAASVKLANDERIVRLLAAMWAYRDEHGDVFPTSLQQLVTDRYLPQIPIDGFTEKPLVYDTKHHSISANASDPKWGTVEDISPLPPSRGR